MSRPNQHPVRFLWRVFAVTAVAFSLAVLSADGGKARKSGHAVRLIVNGAIGPAVADYIHRGLETAVEGGASVVILQMDTPGGLDTSMREIIKDILASPVPVIGHVGPQGARAASAGTYMLYAAHVASMAPATNLGAATPVQLGGGSEKPLPEAQNPEKDVDEEKVKGSRDTDADDAGGSKGEGKDESAPDTPETPEPPETPDSSDAPETYRGKPGMEEKVLND